MQPTEIKELIDASGIRIGEIESELGLAQSTLSKVIKGSRSLNAKKLAGLKRICNRAIKEKGGIVPPIPPEDLCEKYKTPDVPDVPDEIEQEKINLAPPANIEILLELQDLGRRLQTICESIGKTPDEILKDIAERWVPKEPVIITPEEDVRQFPRPDTSLAKFL